MESMIKQMNDAVNLNEEIKSRSPEEQKAAHDKILAKFFTTVDRKEIIAIHAEKKAEKKELDLDSPIYDKLYQYFAEYGDMPYGIQKGRDGDSDEWILDHLDELIAKF